MYITQWQNFWGHPEMVSFMQFSQNVDGFFMQFSQNVDGFRQNDSQSF